MLQPLMFLGGDAFDPMETVYLILLFKGNGVLDPVETTNGVKLTVHPVVKRRWRI